MANPEEGVSGAQGAGSRPAVFRERTYIGRQEPTNTPVSVSVDISPPRSSHNIFHQNKVPPPMESIHRPRGGAAPRLRFKAPQPAYHGHNPNVAAQAQAQSSYAPRPQPPRSAPVPHNIPPMHHIPPPSHHNIPLQRGSPQVQRDFVLPPRHAPHQQRQNFVMPPHDFTPPPPPPAQPNFISQPHNFARPPFNFAQAPQNTPPHTQPYCAPPPQLSSASTSPWNTAYPYAQIPTNLDMNALLQFLSTFLPSQHRKSIPRSVAPFAPSAPRPRATWRTEWLVSCSMQSHHKNCSDGIFSLGSG